MLYGVYSKQCNFSTETGQRTEILINASVSDISSRSAGISIVKYEMEDWDEVPAMDTMWFSETEARTLITQLQRALFAIEDAQMEVE